MQALKEILLYFLTEILDFHMSIIRECLRAIKTQG